MKSFSKELAKSILSKSPKKKSSKDLQRNFKTTLPKELGKEEIFKIIGGEIFRKAYKKHVAKKVKSIFKETATRISEYEWLEFPKKLSEIHKLTIFNLCTFLKRIS